MVSTQAGYKTKLLPSPTYEGFVLSLSSEDRRAIMFGGRRDFDDMVIAPVRAVAPMSDHPTRRLDPPKRNVSRRKVDYLEIAEPGASLGEDVLLEAWRPLETTRRGFIVLSPNLVGHILGPEKASLDMGARGLSRDVFVNACEDHLEVWNIPDWERLAY